MTKLIPALAYGLLLSLSLSGKARAGDLPEWLTGEWIQQRADRWAEEVWTLPRGGTMIGVGRNGRGESQLGWEVLRLVRAADGTLTLHAARGRRTDDVRAGRTGRARHQLRQSRS